MPTLGDDEPFASVLAAHLEDLRLRRYSRSTRVIALTALPVFFSHLTEQGLHDIRSVVEEHVVSFARRLARTKTKRRGQPFSLSSQQTYLAAVQRLFAFLAKTRHILHDPAKDVPLPKADALPRVVLTEAQARRLVSAPSYDNPRAWVIALELRDRAVLELLYGTGIRLSECVRLDVADLDLFHATLWVRNGKGRKDRVVPVAGAAASALDTYLRVGRPRCLRHPREGALFLTATGKRLGTIGLDQMIRRHARRAKIPHIVSAHTLRHTCATHLVRGGADVRHVQELLGHKSIRTTARYTRVVIRDLAAMIERAHPREHTTRKR